MHGINQNDGDVDKNRSAAKTTNVLEREGYAGIRIAIITAKNNSIAYCFRSGWCTTAKQLDERFISLSFGRVVIEIEQIDGCEHSEHKS